MSDQVHQMLAGSLDRTERFTNAIAKLECADRLLLEVGQSVLAVEHAGEMQLGTEAHALQALTSAARVRMAERAHTSARQYGWQVATYLIAPEAQQSGDEAIVWITGNSHFPPLRAYANSDAIWQLDERDYGVWQAYAEGLEGRLEELNVYMGVPEYDNALYVVDLDRFEHVDPYGDIEEDQSPDAIAAQVEDLTLADEWRPKPTD